MKFNEAAKILKAEKEVTIAIEKMQRDLKNESLRHFNKSFKDEGFTYNSLMKWKARKRDSRHRNGRVRKILTGETGRLKNSLYGKVRTSRNTFSVEVQSKSKYAKIHNEGGMGLAWGKHPFKMPKRQFVGYSRVLDLRLTRLFDRRIRQIFKK